MIYKCKKCGQDNLLADEITWSSIYPACCKKCKREITKQKRLEGGIRYSRNKSFKNKYKISIEQYEEMLEKQDNKCASCFLGFNDSIRPDVDHCHVTKVVRGILCHSCNVALGHLRENEQTILNLLSYLRKAKSAAQKD